MSVLTKGLAMDFERQGLAHMSITSIWPAVVSSLLTSPVVPGRDDDLARSNQSANLLSLLAANAAFDS